MVDQRNMSNSLDSFLTRIGDVTIERVTPRGGSPGTSERIAEINESINKERRINDDSSDQSSLESTDVEREKKNDIVNINEIEEIRELSEGSGDDMDLDETIDTQIGVRMDSENRNSESSSPDDEQDNINILDTLPLEGAPIEGQEVTEADLLGLPSKDDDNESLDNDKSESISCGEDDDDPEGNKRRLDPDNPESTKKKQKKDDVNEDSASECETKAEKKLANMRRNIREVMDETQLDEATLSAQRQEMERLRRVQEQQRIIREVQRQIAINRQNNKTQTRVISLLQGKQNQGDTTISETTQSPTSSQLRLPSSVMLKVNSSTGSPQSSSASQSSLIPRRPSEGQRWPKSRGGGQAGAQTSISRVPNRTTGQQNMLQQRIRMMTPSVSISPVVPKKEPIERTDYYSDSEMSDIEEAEEAFDEKQMHHTLRKVSGAPKSLKSAKGKDVVTISSSSESSDDDCIVLSDPSGGEETDTEDDPANSGMHTNDRYNLPDEHGRVLINVGHPDTEPDVYLAPQVARIIKPHQIGGIRFLFDNIVESIERYKNSSGFGCILAHSMGLGKTLQVASFCDIFFRCTTAKTVLCIMPINTLQNWLAEFNMWLPYEDPTLSRNAKSDLKVEATAEKSESKDDLQSDMSRPISNESAHRMAQDIHQQIVNDPANSYQNYDNTIQYGHDIIKPIDHTAHMQPNYHPPPNQNPIYGPTAPFDAMKQDHGVIGRPATQYGIENQQPGVYSAAQNPHYSDMENRNEAGQIYPNNSASTYPFDNSQSAQYGNYQTAVQQPIEPIKKEEPLVNEVNVKIEPTEAVKKEEIPPKIENTAEDAKKCTAKIETPDNVDSPIGMTLRPRHFRLHILNDSHKTMAARSRVVLDWQKNGGVLLIGYELYRQLSLKKPNKAKRKRNQPFKDTVDVEEEDKNKGLLDDMHNALVSPGPDLVICDEGHRIKNSHASISMALKQMKTKRRIVLTGYPLQNNLLEYWCMVDFVRPNYLGTKSEFCNMFERPIQNGQCIDSTPQDIRLMRYRAHVLHALLEGFVQRRSHSVLQISLPRKEEYILLVRMTPHQRKLYDIFMNQVVKTRAVPNPLKAFAVCCKIWNHPDILYHFLRKRQANEEDDLDLEETIGEKSAPGGKRGKPRGAKGEPKKGKKLTATNMKNKPAASVPPNSSSSSSNDNVNEADNKQFATNYSAQVNNTFAPGQQGNYPQNYGNYRPNDTNNYYRNDANHGEYNEFYNNQQGQPRYGNAPFQNYPQSTATYNNPNYPNQQTYIGNNEQSGNPRFTGPEFRAETGPNGNYQTPGMFPRPYAFPERGYNANQTTNYPQNSAQGTNFTANMAQGQTSAVPLNDYGTYGTNNAQNYPPSGEANSQIYSRPDNTHQMQNSAMGYTAGPNQSTNVNQSQSGNYMTQQQLPSTGGNRDFPPPNQPNSAMHNTAHVYPPNQQQPNNAVPMQNQQSHGYTNPNQVGPNSTSQNTAHGYSANQQTGGSNTPNNQQGYIPSGTVQQGCHASNSVVQGTLEQNPMRGYSAGQQGPNNTSGSQASYGTNQTPQQTQNNPYSGDRQQGPTSPSQNSIHGYTGSHLGPPTSATGNAPYSANQANSGAQNHGYTGQQPQSGQSHRYGATTPQTAVMPQNQGINYSAGPNPTGALNSGDQMYPRAESATTQNYSANTATNEYPVDRQVRNPTPTSGGPNFMANNPHGPNNSQNSNYTAKGQSQNSTGTYSENPDDPYWQRNYGQTGRQETCNQEQYFREPSSNRYQNNYYQGQNYGNAPYENYTASQNADEPKNPQGNIVAPRAQNQTQTYDKNVKDSATNVAGQNCPPNNSSTAAGFNGNEGQCIPQQTVGNCQTPNASLGSNDGNKDEDKDKDDLAEKDKDDKSDDELLTKDEEKDSKFTLPGMKEEPGIPYDWATDLMKGYVPGLIDASAKMTLFFCILEEAVRLGDRVLAFSQSLFTLNLIEDFLSRNNLKYTDGRTESWMKNVNYYRLDGSTSALEREKLINEFNCNPKIHLFLVSTRAGSLGINLVGANRAIVFDASWNPCHDTQAVCRVYRYGQTKPCFVYRLVTDNCLERKIYDRQISKQGMADRVVDQCNPDAHLSLKEATTLSWDWEEDSQVQDFSQSKENYTDEVMRIVLERHSSLLTKEPFHHESLLVDRKDKKLSQAEKRLARRGYELEKMAANCSRPSYSYVPGNTATRAGGLQIRAIRGVDAGTTQKPVASVRPMQQRGAENLGNRGIVGSRWIPAEVWQRQGMSAQEMTLPLDVVIPTNSPDKGSIVLKAGQRVMVLKSPKGIYMQLESGKIIAIRTALKLNQQKRDEEPKKGVPAVTSRTTTATTTPTTTTPTTTKPEVSFPLRNNTAISLIPKATPATSPIGTRPLSRPGSVPGFKQYSEKETPKRGRIVATGAAKPQISQITTLTHHVSLQRFHKAKQEQQQQQSIEQTSSIGENSNSSDSQMRTEQRVEEVQLEDVVAEAGNEYSPSNKNRDTNNDNENPIRKHEEEDKAQEVYKNSESTRHNNPESNPENSSKIVANVTENLSSTTLDAKNIDKSDTNYGNFANQGEKCERKSDGNASDETSGKLASVMSGSLNPTEISQTRNLEIKNDNATTIDSGIKERDSRVQELSQEPHNLPQGYPYAQYPRYYDYADPRSRTLPNPYGTYFPGVGNPPRLPIDNTKIGHCTEQTKNQDSNQNVGYPQSGGIGKTGLEIGETKNNDTNNQTINNASRDEGHVPTAFSHPASSRYPGPYPPAPYDPYTQHYPPAPGSSAAYPPSGAPGYAAYGGPTYNTDYARMYSAFHGPPPAATDPYMHRGYAPPSTHPTNYYPPFPHPPPPPYPNYTFLPPYPNPNMSGEPQPPNQ